MNDPSAASSQKQPRRAQIAHACGKCRGSKVKCAGERPICSRCQKRGLDCLYEVFEEGMTKRESLKRELSGNRRQLENATAILDVMRFGTDMAATETLARLRLGMDTRNVLNEYSSQFEQQRPSTSDLQRDHAHLMDNDRPGASPPMQSDDEEIAMTTTNSRATTQTFENETAHPFWHVQRPS